MRRLLQCQGLKRRLTPERPSCLCTTTSSLPPRYQSLMNRFRSLCLCVALFVHDPVSELCALILLCRGCGDKVETTPTHACLRVRFSAKLYFTPIRESFLPRKIPAIPVPSQHSYNVKMVFVAVFNPFQFLLSTCIKWYYFDLMNIS